MAEGTRGGEVARHASRLGADSPGFPNLRKGRSMDETTALLNLNSAKLEVLLVRLDTVARVVYRMSAEIDRLKTSVQKLTDVQQGAVALLQQLASEIRAKAQDSQAITALADEVDQRAAELGKAVTDNTGAGSSTTTQEAVTTTPAPATGASQAQGQQRGPAAGQMNRGKMP
jgi:hypothetical protein